MTISKLIFDTDVLIDYIRGYEKAEKFFITNKVYKFFLSSVTVAELFAGARNKSEIEEIDILLQSFEVIDVDIEIAKQGGLFKQKYGKVIGTGLMDALIAATSISIKADIVTLNKKHYPSEVNIITPYTKNIN